MNKWNRFEYEYRLNESFLISTLSYLRPDFYERSQSIVISYWKLNFPIGLKEMIWIACVSIRMQITEIGACPTKSNLQIASRFRPVRFCGAGTRFGINPILCFGELSSKIMDRDFVGCYDFGFARLPETNPIPNPNLRKLSSFGGN